MLWRFRDFTLTKFLRELARGGPEAQAWALRTSWGAAGAHSSDPPPSNFIYLNCSWMLGSEL